MVLLIVAFGALYALPNLYGKDPAVQISGLRGVEINASTIDNVKTKLDNQNIPFSSIVLNKDQILARFLNTEHQFPHFGLSMTFVF